MLGLIGEEEREVEITIELEVESQGLLEEMREKIIQQNRGEMFKKFGRDMFSPNSTTMDNGDSRKHKKKEENKSNKEDVQPTRKSQRQMSSPPPCYTENLKGWEKPKKRKMENNNNSDNKNSDESSENSNESNNDDNNNKPNDNDDNNITNIVNPKVHVISAQILKPNEPITQPNANTTIQMHNTNGKVNHDVEKPKKPKLINPKQNTYFNETKKSTTEQKETNSTKMQTFTRIENENETKIKLDNSGGFCHNCKRKNHFSKIRCTNIIKRKGVSLVCGITIDEHCLLNRYGIVLSEISSQCWTCPKCLGICNCAACLKSEGQEIVDKIKVSKLGYKSVAEYLYENEYYNQSTSSVEERTAFESGKESKKEFETECD